MFRYPPPVTALFLVLIAAAILTAQHVTAQQTIKVKDGFLQENMVYTEITKLDLTGLDNTRKVSSTGVVRNGQIKNQLYITGGGGTPSDTFATSLYMTCTKMHIACTASNIVCYYYIEYLPPNAYILLKETTSSKTDRYRSIAVQTGWEYNTTLVILDSDLEDKRGTGPSAFLTFPPTGRPHSFVDNCVMYVKNMKVTNHRGVISFNSTLEQQSALVFEDIQGVNLRGPVLNLLMFFIKDHSAFIVIRLKSTHDSNAKLNPFLHTTALDVDETSTFSLMDIDVSNNFIDSTAGMFSDEVKITGGGVIVFSRLLMQRSGLPTKQPLNNANFWVSARMSANDDLTVAQLKEQNFNVNDKHVYNWDGTGADGITCVPVGASIPGRATYKLVEGKCAATCKEGFIPPACTAPAKSQCRVDNCDLCYRVTKTKCMMCAEHTTYENNDQECRCPANLEHCLICPSATTCTLCVDGYSLTRGGAACVPCSITVPNCFHCEEPNLCEQCAPHYNVSGNKKECYPCNVANCLHCSSNEVCDACVPHYNLSATGTPPRSRCISCKVPNCLLCKEDDTCDTCATGYTKPEGKGTCVHCPIDRCERCDTDGVCAQCSDKNTLVNGKHCYACTMPGCLSCDGDEQCAQCDAKHTLVGTNCVSCDIPNCTSCLVDGVCVQCEPKYTLHNDGANSQCIPCAIDGCSTCDADSHCSVCANGNPVDDGKECVSCDVDNCVLCNATDSCAECSDRHSLFNDAGKLKCISCNVNHCAFCGSADTCQQCEATYNLSRTGDKCNACFIEGCQRCDQDGVCALCGTNQSVSLNDAGCTPCAIGNCTSCSASGKCNVCDCGMVPTINAKDCVLCTVVHCNFCDLPGDGKKCAECTEGYTVSNGVCRKVKVPSWGVFLIVVAATIILAALLCLGVFLYLRYQAGMRQKELDAAERRRNRLVRGRHTRQHTKISLVDLSDIEGAANGVRDNYNARNIKL